MFSLKVPDVFKELIRKVFVKPEERKLALCLGEKRLLLNEEFMATSTLKTAIKEIIFQIKSSMIYSE